MLNRAQPVACFLCPLGPQSLDRCLRPLSTLDASGQGLSAPRAGDLHWEAKLGSHPAGIPVSTWEASPRCCCLEGLDVWHLRPGTLDLALGFLVEASGISLG